MAAPDESTKRSDPGHPPHILPTDRLNAFADGVFAIVITLLVLELPVPEVADGLLWALLEQWPDFLAYIISFVFIGGFWITHAAITRLTEQEDQVTFRLTLITLFFISLIPFSTSLMATHLTGSGSRLSVLLYGLNLLIASIMLSGIMRYLARRRELLVDDLAEEDVDDMERKRRSGIIFNAIGVLLALLFPPLAVAAYIGVAFFFFLQPLLYKRIIRRSLKT
ncbi:TMEM175 family protein [Methanoculleus taiwanensis]|nr:TMEM175 family protein [Methanoculleus taiwanensis]